MEQFQPFTRVLRANVRMCPKCVHEVMAIAQRNKVCCIDAVPRPATVDVERIPLTVQKPQITRVLGDISHADVGHLLRC